MQCAGSGAPHVGAMIGFVLYKNAELIYLALVKKKKEKEKSTAHLQWSSNRSDLTVSGRLLNHRRGQSADCVMC